MTVTRVMAIGAAPRDTVWRTVNKDDVVPIAILIVLSSLALSHLMAVPPFEDEGSQLRWIWRAIVAGEWLEPLGEGKPLEAWPMVPLVRFAPQPLAAIRAVHVLCGMMGAVLTYLLAREVTDRRIALASGVLVATCPFVVYLERFALSDILMCTAGVWALLGIIRLIRSPTWWTATSLGLALVLAALAKLPVGFVFLTSMPLALLLMPAHERGTLLHRPALLKVLVAHLPAVLLGVAAALVAVVRMWRGQPPGFGMQDLMGIGLGRYRDIAAVTGVSRPSLIGELTVQLSAPVVAIGLMGIAAIALLGDWRQRWLIVLGAAPMLVIGYLTAFWFSRYLLFALPPLIVAAASGWHSLSVRLPRYARAAGIAVFGLCVGLMVHQSARLVLDPLTARWSPSDRFQYFEGWGSGYGYPEAAQFLLGAPDAPRMIFALDGHSAYQLRTYLPTSWSDRVQPIGYGESGTTLRSQEARLEYLLNHAPAWIVVSEQLLQHYLQEDFGAGSDARVRLRRIASFDKPGMRAQLAIYEATRG